MSLAISMHSSINDLRSATPPKPQAARNAPVAMLDANSQRRQIGACHLSSESSQIMNDRAYVDFRYRVVQDLERQLQETRQQLERLRATMSQTGLSPTRSHEYNQRGPAISPFPRASPSVQKATLPHEYSTVKSQVLNHGRGLIRARTAECAVKHISTREAPELPPQQVAEHAIFQYRDCFHRQYPVVHWPKFQQTYDLLYAKQPVSRDALSIFFCVVAYGTLCSQRPNKTMEGMEYIEKAHPLDGFLKEAQSSDAVVVNFLTSTFFVETGDIATALVWLARAIRIAQNLDFHLRTGQDESSERISRIWFSLYCWDRYV